MANIEITSHYNDTVKIKFYVDSHRYQIDGRKDYLIGVTTATGQMDKSRALLIWASRLTRDHLLEALNKEQQITQQLIEEACNLYNAKREEAATSGTLVHDWAERYIKGENPEVPEDENVRNGVIAFLKWVNENGIKFLASEKRVYSKKHEYAGTMDCIFTMAKEDHKIIHAGDFKTSSGFYIEMPMQVSAYQEAETEEHGTQYDDKYIIKFDKTTGEFEVKCFPASEHKQHFQGFLACLQLKKLAKEWDKIHGYYAKKPALI